MALSFPLDTGLLKQMPKKKKNPIYVDVYIESLRGELEALGDIA